MVKFIYKVLPVFITYTENGIPEKFGGLARFIIVKVRPKYLNDNGLLQHELTHVKQFYRTCGIHALLYPYNKTYRLKAELEGYKEQLKWYPDESQEDLIDLFSKFISEKYDLGISIEDAKKLLVE